MDDEIQLINDGDGLAVIGEPSAVDRFLSSEGLESKDLGLRRLGPALGRAAGVAEMGSQIAANSGRWVKLTEESAQAIKKYGLMKNSQTGLSMGVVQAKGQGGGHQGNRPIQQRECIQAGQPRTSGWRSGNHGAGSDAAEHG